MNLKEITDLIIKQAEAKKFGTKPDEINVAEKIALIHTEISEAYEAYRHQNIDGKNGFKEELGDVVIRVIHLCGVFDINLEEEILKKMESNENREWDWDKMNEKHS